MNTKLCKNLYKELVYVKRHFFYYWGVVDDLSFFDYPSPFYFLLIEFHSIFFISYTIIPCYVYQYCIFIR